MKKKLLTNFDIKNLMMCNSGRVENDSDVLLNFLSMAVESNGNVSQCLPLASSINCESCLNFV